MVSNIGGIKKSWDANGWKPSDIKQNNTIIIPFKPMSQEEASAVQQQREAEIGKRIEKLRKQAAQAGIPSSVLDDELRIYSPHNMTINVKNHAIVVGDPNGDRVETVYKKGEIVKTIQYSGNKKQVEEFSNGYRTFTEYEKNSRGQYVIKYFVKTPETDYYNKLEEHQY